VANPECHVHPDWQVGGRIDPEFQPREARLRPGDERHRRDSADLLSSGQIEHAAAQ
jgi:hypothetical protein